jgi:hypothetical protein
MAGKIIADTIESAGSQISLNVGNVTVLTASSTGLTLIPTTNVNINLTNSIVNLTSGNVTNPSLTFSGNTSTGMYMPTTNAIAFTTAGTEDMRITSDGNVGIGTSSPNAFGNRTFEVSAGASGASYIVVTTASNTIKGEMALDGGIMYISTKTNHPMVFRINDVERMRIDTSGNFRFGQTTGNSDARTSINGGSTDSSPCIDYVKNSSTTTTAQVYARFTAGSTGTGSITANGPAAAAFTAWSDRRLKQNITNLPSQLNNIMALRPVEFDYVESMGGVHQLGFIAQEVQEIYPDLVGEGVDGMLTLTDMNKNDARLIKAIQELKAIVDAQAVEIAALKAK